MPAWLLRHFGTMEAAISASLDALAEVDGIGPAVASKIRWAVEESAGGYLLPANSHAATGTL